MSIKNHLNANKNAVALEKEKSKNARLETEKKMLAGGIVATGGAAAFFAVKSRKTKKSWDEDKGLISGLNAKVTGLESEKIHLEEQVTLLNQDLSEKEVRIGKLDEYRANLSDLLKKKEADLEAFDKDITACKATISSLKSQAVVNQQMIDSLQSQLESAPDSVLTKKCEKLEAEKAALQSDLDAANQTLMIMAGAGAPPISSTTTPLNVGVVTNIPVAGGTPSKSSTPQPQNNNSNNKNGKKK